MRLDLTPLTRAAVRPHPMFRALYSPSYSQPGTWIVDHWAKDGTHLGRVRMDTEQGARDVAAQTGRVPIDAVARLDAPRRVIRSR